MATPKISGAARRMTLIGMRATTIATKSRIASITPRAREVVSWKVVITTTITQISLLMASARWMMDWLSI